MRAKEDARLKLFAGKTGYHSHREGPLAKTATDGALPFSVVAKTNKERPAWIRGWLMDPHPPMLNISLSRQQIDDIVAYLGTLPTQ